MQFIRSVVTRQLLAENKSSMHPLHNIAATDPNRTWRFIQTKENRMHKYREIGISILLTLSIHKFDCAKLLWIPIPGIGLLPHPVTMKCGETLRTVESNLNNSRKDVSHFLGDPSPITPVGGIVFAVISHGAFRKLNLNLLLLAFHPWELRRRPSD